jgi:pre-60S factor REI1
MAIEAAAGSDSDKEEQDEGLARRNEIERGRALMSRANGGLGMVGVTAEKRKEVKAAEKRSRKVEQREKRKYEWGVNKQNNSQKHFRVSIHPYILKFLSLIASRIPYCNDFQLFLLHFCGLVLWNLNFSFIDIRIHESRRLAAWMA